MKTKLLLTLVLITQITLAQQVTLMQPALRDSDKNIIKYEYYTIDIDTNVEHKLYQILYTDYDEEKNPIVYNYESYDENGNVIDSGNSDNVTIEYYQIDEYNAERNFFVSDKLFPNKLIDAKILNTNTNELLDYYYALYPKDDQFSDYYDFYLEYYSYQYDENFNLTGGDKMEAIMQGDYLSERLFYIFNETTSEVELNNKSIYYNTFDNGVLTERITKRITDITTNIEENYMKETFTFLTSTFEHQYFNWNTTSNTWELDFKTVTTYNANNQPLNISRSSWDETTSTWNIYTEYTCNYNALGFLETYTKDDVVDNEWDDFYTFTYNSDNLLTEIIIESYLLGEYNSKSRQAFYYEPETASTNETNTSIINIYPNPTNKILNIDLESNFEYQIYSIQGKLLKDGVANKQIQVSDLEKGIYFIQIKTANSEEKQKFVVN